MRIVYVWVTAITLLAVIIGSWYFWQPIIYMISDVSNSTFAGIESDTALQTRMSQTTIILQLANNVGHPILAILVLVWAWISSQKQDWESSVYG